MRTLYLLIAAAVLSAETAPSRLDKYERAVSTHHGVEAGVIVDELIRERVPPNGVPRPDPLLNAMIGRLFLISEHSAEAAIYLDHAPISELPAELRAPTALDHGKALELHSQRSAALLAYREAVATARTEEQRNRASLGIARQLVTLSPAEARQQLSPLANGPASAHRWEARYLLALSSSLAGDSASARQMADLAWSDAAVAPLTDLAPLRVEMLRAGLAAAANDAASERAMLTASNGLKLSASTALNSQLPICGDSGLRPTDWVIFGFASGPAAIRDFMPIAASRPEAVLPFQLTLSGIRPIKEKTQEDPYATVFTVRCRTLVSQNFIASPSLGDPFVKWTVERGLYPASVWNDAADEHLNSATDWVDSLAKRFGPDSPLLIFPRWQVYTLLQARARDGDPVLPGQLSDLETQVADGLRKAGGPEWLISSIELQKQIQQAALAAGTDDQDALASQIGPLIQNQVKSAPFEIARPVISTALSNLHGDWPAEAAQTVLDVNLKLPPSLSLRERQAWQLNVAAAYRATGKNSLAKKALAGAGLPADICQAADSAPRLLDQHFSYRDYPDDILVGEQEGAVLFEFDLAKDGSPINSRAVYSLPSGLFDEVSRKGLLTVRYDAPERNGVPASCRAVYQPIVWRLEEEDGNFVLPVLTPQPAGPMT